jgi:uncharacterized membrane protein YdbT with pleckstrin-like domain
MMRYKELKPGNQTTEFKLTLLMNIVTALLTLFVAYGVFTTEEASLWSQLIMSIAVVVVPLASIYMTKEYNMNRTGLKLEVMQNPIQPLQLTPNEWRTEAGYDPIQPIPDTE